MEKKSAKQEALTKDQNFPFHFNVRNFRLGIIIQSFLILVKFCWEKLRKIAFSCRALGLWFTLLMSEETSESPHPVQCGNVLIHVFTCGSI